MKDLTKTQKPNIGKADSSDLGDDQKKSGGLQFRSLDDIKNEAGFENLGVVIDNSGSMAGDYDGKNTRSAASQMAIEKLWEKTDFAVCELQVWNFDDQTIPLNFTPDTPPKVLSPNGGTNFQIAIATPLRENCNRIILASDGESIYPAPEIKECKEKGVKVDTIFIGAPGTPGEALLKKISEDTGGLFCSVDDTENLVSAFEQLETHNRLALEYQPDADNENSVIKL